MGKEKRREGHGKGTKNIVTVRCITSQGFLLCKNFNGSISSISSPSLHASPFTTSTSLSSGDIYTDCSTRTSTHNCAQNNIMDKNMNAQISPNLLSPRKSRMTRWDEGFGEMSLLEEEDEWPSSSCFVHKNRGDVTCLFHMHDVSNITCTRSKFLSDDSRSVSRPSDTGMPALLTEDDSSMSVSCLGKEFSSSKDGSRNPKLSEIVQSMDTKSVSDTEDDLSNLNLNLNMNYTTLYAWSSRDSSVNSGMVSPTVYS